MPALPGAIQEALQAALRRTGRNRFNLRFPGGMREPTSEMGQALQREGTGYASMDDLWSPVGKAVKPGPLLGEAGERVMLDLDNQAMNDAVWESKYGDTDMGTWMTRQANPRNPAAGGAYGRAQEFIQLFGSPEDALKQGWEDLLDDPETVRVLESLVSRRKNQAWPEPWPETDLQQRRGLMERGLFPDDTWE